MVVKKKSAKKNKNNKSDKSVLKKVFLKKGSHKKGKQFAQKSLTKATLHNKNTLLNNKIHFSLYRTQLSLVHKVDQHQHDGHQMHSHSDHSHADHSHLEHSHVAHEEGKKHLHPVLRSVHYDCVFKLADGRVLSNVYDFALALQQMDDSVFQKHVNGSKNEFVSWLRDAVHANDLADQLQQVTSKQEIETSVLRYLVNNLTDGTYAHDYMNVPTFFNSIK